jgi:peroxiredoxin
MKKKLVYSLLVVLCSFSLHAQIGLEVGDDAPDFELKALDGTLTTLEDYKGKVLVIKTWFTGCTPCILEIPQVNTLVEKYQDREDIAFLAPSPNSSIILDKFMAKADFKYEVMSGSYYMLKKYNPSNRYPTHIIVGKDGKVALVLAKTSDTIAEELDAVIQTLL